MATENLHYTPLYIHNAGLQSSTGEPYVWVVMRSTHGKVAVGQHTGDNRRNSQCQYGYELIQSKVCKFFMPMKETVVTRSGRQIRTVSPAIPNIFFVNDTLSHIDRLVAADNGVEYLYIKGRPYREPVIIRDSEMENFIAATTSGQRVTFHTAGSDTLSRLIGRRVRIAHADGFIEGELLTIRGSRYRRLRVALPASSIVAYIDLHLSPDTLVESVD